MKEGTVLQKLCSPASCRWNKMASYLLPLKKKKKLLWTAPEQDKTENGEKD